MRKFLHTIGALIALALACAAVFFAYRSHWKSDGIEWGANDLDLRTRRAGWSMEHIANRGRGGPGIGLFHEERGVTDAYDLYWDQVVDANHDSRIHLLGFDLALWIDTTYAPSSSPYTYNLQHTVMWRVTIPHWALICFFLYMACRWNRRRLSGCPATGLCKGCGYDLRASRDRCPECGKMI